MLTPSNLFGVLKMETPEVVSEVFANMTEEQKEFLGQFMLETFVFCSKCKRTVQLVNARHIAISPVTVGSAAHDFFCSHKDCGVMISWRKL